MALNPLPRQNVHFMSSERWWCHFTLDVSCAVIVLYVRACVDCGVVAFEFFAFNASTAQNIIIGICLGHQAASMYSLC